MKDRSRLLFHVLAAALILSLVAPLWAPPAQAARVRCAETYVVKGSESLSRIARKYGLSTSSLAEANGLKAPYHLGRGDRLCIPYKAGSSHDSEPEFSLQLSGRMLVIKGLEFPASAAYNVRVDDRSRFGLNWVKIGKIKSNQNGVMNARLVLPQSMRSDYSLNVCLKDIISDEVWCGVAYR